MKKIFCVALILAFILSNCGKAVDSGTTSTVDSALTSAQGVEDTEKHEVNSVSENYEEGESATAAKKDIIEQSEESSSPMIIYMTFQDLKEIKNAFGNLPADDFINYMKDNKLEQYMTGMCDYESAKALLKEIEGSAVALLDGDVNNFSEIAFYWEIHEINQIISFDENKRFVAVTDTPLNKSEKKMEFREGTKIAEFKTITTDDYTAKLYLVNDERLYADVVFNDGYIVLRSNINVSPEEFEADFARLQFVKIGDLL